MNRELRNSVDANVKMLSLDISFTHVGLYEMFNR